MSNNRIRKLAARIMIGESIELEDLSPEDRRLLTGNYLDLIDLFTAGQSFVIETMRGIREHDRERAIENGDLPVPTL